MHTLVYATQEYEVLVSEAKIKNTLIVVCILYCSVYTTTKVSHNQTKWEQFKDLLGSIDYSWSSTSFKYKRFLSEPPSV